MDFLPAGIALVLLIGVLVCLVRACTEIRECNRDCRQGRDCICGHFEAHDDLH